MCGRERKSESERESKRQRKTYIPESTNSYIYKHTLHHTPFHLPNPCVPRVYMSHELIYIYLSRTHIYIYTHTAAHTFPSIKSLCFPCINESRTHIYIPEFYELIYTCYTVYIYTCHELIYIYIHTHCNTHFSIYQILVLLRQDLRVNRRLFGCQFIDYTNSYTYMYTCHELMYIYIHTHCNTHTFPSTKSSCSSAKNCV